MENKQLLSLVNRWFDAAIVIEAAIIIAGIASLHIITLIISMLFLILLPFSLIKKSIPGLLASFLIHVTLIFFLRSSFFYSDSVFQLWLTICIFSAGFSGISYYLGRKLQYLMGLEGYPYFNEMPEESINLSYIRIGETNENKDDKNVHTEENSVVDGLITQKEEVREITGNAAHGSMVMDSINTDNLDTREI